MNSNKVMPPAIRPPQFSLRTLLLLMTGCAILFALINVLPPMIIAGLIFLFLSIFAHVAGNAIGTRLRDLGGRTAEFRRGTPEEMHVVGPTGPPRCAPRTELSRRQSLGWPVLAVSAAGTLVGGIGGGIWTTWLSRDHLTALGVAVGSVACGVLSGFAAFLAFSFAQVGLGALRQALASSSTSAEDTQR